MAGDWIDEQNVAIIAAVVEANDCVVVTDNEQHFAGIEIVNPMRRGEGRRRECL
jgi:hypothetical protein